MVNRSLYKRVVNARLFLGQLADHDDQQDDHYHTDHRPKPHSSAHPSVCMVHHVLFLSFCFSFWFGVGVRLTACLRNRLHRDLHGCQHSDCSVGGGFAMGYNPTVDYRAGVESRRRRPTIRCTRNDFIPAHERSRGLRAVTELAIFWSNNDGCRLI